MSGPARTTGYVSGRSRPDAAIIGFGVLLAATTLATYAPVAGYGFVNFDDPGYVSSNPHVARGLGADTVLWAFTSGRTGNWIPVTWLSYLLDVSLFGVRAEAHHVVNLLLHVANVLLLFALGLRLGCTAPLAACIAALFALHPLRVESVAWISERKDVLCALFGLSTLHAWVGWKRCGGWSRYAATLVLFALGLMAKPMLVTLPFVMLLLDFWPLARMQGSPPAYGTSPPAPSLAGLLVEKLPFFGLALTSSVVAFLVQRSAGAIADPIVLPLSTRIRGALAAYAWYAGKTLWPRDLAALYPNVALVGGSEPVAAVAAGALLLVGGGLVALYQARRRPWLLVGFGIFVGMLVPVVGLVQVGQQSTADRYTYLPGIGLSLVVAGLLAEAARPLLSRSVRIACAVGLLVALAAATRVQIGTWRDSVTLARRAIAVTEGNYVMHFNLAVALDEQGDLSGALASYGEAVRIRPDLAGFRVNHGAALARSGRGAAAVAEYEAALRVDPRDPAARNNLAWLRATHPDAALRDGAQALVLARALAQERPADPDTLDLLAAALAERGRFADAARTAEAAIATAQRTGRGPLALQIEARRTLYAAGRAYREDPSAAAVTLPPA